MLCVRGQGSCVTCSSALAVGITITEPVWTLLSLPESGLAGSVLNAKCAKPAGNLETTLRCWFVRRVTKDTIPSA